MNYLVERFWPGSTEEGAVAAMQRLRLSCAQLVADGIDVKWLGGTFVPSDESLSCRFEGTAQAIRALHEIAGEPFDRIVAAVEVDDQ